MAPVKLLFVCLGNICRSPAAENLMTHLLQQRGLSDRVLCDSAGTSGYHIGAPPDRRMAAAAAHSPGIQLQGSARRFRPQDLSEFDLILAMDRDNYADILACDPQETYRDRIKLMSEFCRHHTQPDVPDPYYGGPDGFRFVIEMLQDACEGLLDFLQATGKLSAKLH